MPEKGPLQGLVTLEIVLEAEPIFFVGVLEEVEEFGGSLVDGERGRLGVVDEDRDAT